MATSAAFKHQRNFIKLAPVDPRPKRAASIDEDPTTSKRLCFEESDTAVLQVSPEKCASLDLSGLREDFGKMDCVDKEESSQGQDDSIISSDASRQESPQPENIKSSSDESGLHDMEDDTFSPIKRADSLVTPLTLHSPIRAVVAARPRRRYTMGNVPQTPMKVKSFIIHRTALS
ncbi:uncharacterized protein LOC129597998 [Paramacrobiotus metropolitanus]|uniref:uncharacterized protein LOC129597998 n=1 Tax=Paramacrobiotus metropolitanus TaxID=2943436 RepID=UPI00244566D0|nr:uncharacterized protein LOC129597998 [Paramacrobiotus metropolitanus]